MKKCGPCQLCCKLLPVQEFTSEFSLAKPGGERCPYQRFNKGCKIYKEPHFPSCCREGSCRWVLGMLPEDSPRPDKVGYVIDLLPDYMTYEGKHSPLIQVWVKDEHLPLDNYKVDIYLMNYMNKMADQGYGFVFRALGDQEALLMLRLPDGQWGYTHSSQLSSPRRKQQDHDIAFQVAAEFGGTAFHDLCTALKRSESPEVAPGRTKG